MNTFDIPNQERPTSVRLPRWTTPILLALLFLLVHVAIPCGLSRLSSRHGWANRRPGKWNLLALIPVVAGIVSTIWLITLHFRASPDTFLEWKQGQKLLMRSPYAVSRNPMYLCELTFWLGWALFYGSIPVFIGFLLWWAGFNFVIVPYEERELEARFGEAYRAYKAQVPRWLGRA
jgi:protein-S-isoprenylcysteine O-methyltransferase Ste14